MRLPASMVFNILVRKEEGLYVAHCLELDIVSANVSSDKASTDIIGLIIAQIDYAFSNDNLDFLYRPAPAYVWEEFYSCKKQIENKIKITSTFNTPKTFVPPLFVARTCTAPDNSCYA